MDNLQLTLLHSERPKLYTILAFLSAIRLIQILMTVMGELSFSLYKKLLKTNVMPTPGQMQRAP